MMEAQINPKNSLQFAKESLKDYKKNKEDRDLISAFWFISKGLHTQIDLLVDYISTFKKSRKKLELFPDKFNFVKGSHSITLPDGIQKLNNLRNDLEHRHKYPSSDVVDAYLTALEFFISTSEKFMTVDATELKNVVDEKLKFLEMKMKKNGKSKRSIESYKFQSEKFFYFYAKRPSSLTGDDANNYLRELIDEGCPPRHIQQIEAIISFLYDHILNEKWVKNYKRPPIKGKEPTQLYYTHIQKILKYAPSFRDQLIIRFIYYTGLKAGQVVKAKIEDIPKFNLRESELKDLTKYLGKRDKGPIFLSQYNVGLGQRGIERIFEIITKKYGRRVYSEMIRKSNPSIRHQRSGITAKGSRRPRFVLNRDQVINKKEFQLLLDNAGNKLKRDYIYFVYHFQLGLTQFINIKFDDIDFKRGLINVKPSKKHYKKEQIYLEKEVIDTLKEYCKEHKIKKGKELFEYVLNSIRNIIQDAGKAAGLEEKKLGYGVLANSIEFSKIYGIK